MIGVIDVAIGLIVVYIVFALVASQIVEAIATRLNQRGKGLFAGVERLVTDPTVGVSVLTAIRTHPLIKHLSQNDKRLPSYVPDRHFSLALIDAVRANTRAVNPAFDPLKATPDELLDDVQARVKALPAGPFKESLSSLLQQTHGTYDQVLRTIDGWFNAEMDRVSGWYSRWASAITFAAAGVLVLLFDVDTFRIVDQLGDFTIRTAAAGAGASLSSSANAQQAVSALLATGLTFTWYHGFTVWTLAGLIVSWLAVSLGAPFWFDVLKTFISVRNAGPKPQPSQAAPAVAQPADNAPLLLNVLSQFLAAGNAPPKPAAPPNAATPDLGAPTPSKP